MVECQSMTSLAQLASEHGQLMLKLGGRREKLINHKSRCLVDSEEYKLLWTNARIDCQYEQHKRYLDEKQSNILRTQPSISR